VDYSEASGGQSVFLNLGSAGGSDGSDTLVSIENVQGTDFAEWIAGTDSANHLNGADGEDLIGGLGGGDTINGGPGDDIVNGDDGADTIFAGQGNDAISGGLGNDTIDGGAGSEDWMDYSWATGWVSTCVSPTTGADGGDTLTNIENVEGSEFDDCIAATNRAFGGDGDDIIISGTGYAPTTRAGRRSPRT
jgi:Ca2+-binding RTX toxin-like protein